MILVIHIIVVGAITITMATGTYLFLIGIKVTFCTEIMEMVHSLKLPLAQLLQMLAIHMDLLGVIIIMMAI